MVVGTADQRVVKGAATWPDGAGGLGNFKRYLQAPEGNTARGPELSADYLRANTVTSRNIPYFINVRTTK